MPAIIETERIILRRFLPGDEAAVLELNANPEVQKYTGDRIITTLAEAQDTINNVWLSDYEKYGYGRFAVIYKPDDKLIGFAGLKYLPDLGETDIGFRILPQYWGVGILSEIAGDIIDYGFSQLALTKIIGTVMPDNIASIKILEKIGLIYDKTEAYGHDGVLFNFYSISV